MKVKIKDLREGEKEITIDVPEDMVALSYDKFYKEIAPKAKVQGFRPGKAPRNVLERHYGKDADKEVLETLVSESYRKAIKEEGIVPLAQPAIKDVNFEAGKRLSFKAEVEIRPDVKVKKYTGLKAKKEKVEVTDKEIEDALARVREGNAKFNPVEDRPAEIGDYVVADISVTVDGKESDTKKDEWFQLNDENKAPINFAKDLVGMKPGEEREVEVEFPKDFPKKDFAGKKGVYKVKVKEIKEKKLPELNDEWAKELGGFKSLDEVKKAIRTDLENHKKQEVEQKYERELLDKLVKNSDFVLSKGVVERRLNTLVESAINNLMQQGWKQEDAMKEKDELRKRLKDEAERRVRVAFILDKIAELEGIKVTEKELEAEYGKMAAQYGVPVDKIKEFYRNESRLESLVMQVVNGKVINLIKEKAEAA